jgi:DNA-binding transcriptional MerR regulator
MTRDNSKQLHTVTQLARLSGVSVRTLHHYHALGLLKPADLGANGYRYYGRSELLRLQQILVYRELGLSLERIRDALDTPDFDRAAALRKQRGMLQGEVERLGQLMRTLDDTLCELNGGTPLADRAIYRGFTAEIRARSDSWALDHYGGAARWGIETRDRVTATWSDADWDRHDAAWTGIFQDFVAALRQGIACDGDTALELAHRVHALSSQSWTGPLSRGGMLNLAGRYVECPDMQSGLEELAPGLSNYVSAAVRAFATQTGPWTDAISPRDTELGGA